MGDEALTTAAEFQIHELTGPRRTVALTGRGLPYRPFTLDGTQRVETEWYAGNPEGTQTVLGASEEPTTLTGKWKDMYLSGSGSGNTHPIVVDKRQVTTAKAICKIMDTIRRQGQAVEVTWDEITRRGILKRFRQEWDDLHDVAWTMEFEWYSQGEDTVPATLDGQNSVQDTNAQLQAQKNVLDVQAVPPFPVPEQFTTDLGFALGQLSTSVQSAQNAGNVQALGATTPDDAARRVFAATNSIVQNAADVVGVCAAQPARALLSGDPLEADIGVLPYGRVVAAETYVRATMRTARVLQRTAAVRRAAFARSLQSDLIGVWQAGAGEDLRDVAQEFYGTRLQWRGLLLFNELTSTLLARGQVVLVPRVSSGRG